MRFSFKDFIQTHKLLCILTALVLVTALLAGYIFFLRPLLYRQQYALDYKDIITAEATKNTLDPYLVAAVIYTESGYDPKAKSRAGAEGLMQLMPATAQEVAGWLSLVAYDAFAPEDNIALGCRYLRYLIDQLGSEQAAVAAYNGGIGNVRKWIDTYGKNEQGVPNYIPYPETDKYVKKVFAAVKTYRKLYPTAFNK